MAGRVGDLTGRARVRDAALVEFAERGPAGASVRSVAARAGVSPGLVQHHFATKDTLRQACDDYAVEYVGRAALDGVAGGGIADPQRLAALQAEGGPVVAYLARALSDGSPGSAVLFDDLVAVTESYLAVVAAPARGVGSRDRAVVLTAMRLATLVLGAHVARGLGLDNLEGDGSARVAAATASLLHPDLLSATSPAAGSVAVPVRSDDEGTPAR